MLRSVFAVVSGYLAMAVIVRLATFVLYGLRPAWFAGKPQAVFLVLSIGYTAVAAFAAGWLTARLAMQKHFLHAVVLAVLTFALEIVATVLAGEGQPRWYQALLIILTPAAVIAGGRLRQSAVEARQSAS